jgi:hypothetical protein
MKYFSASFSEPYVERISQCDKLYFKIGRSINVDSNYTR